MAVYMHKGQTSTYPIHGVGGEKQGHSVATGGSGGVATAWAKPHDPLGCPGGINEDPSE